MKKKKFTPSELRWLAENLNNEQIASLLESDQPQQTPDAMQGVPSNPGMQSVDNPGAMKPTDGGQDQGKDYSLLIKQLCDSMKSGKLAQKNPQDIAKVFQAQPGSMEFVIPRAIKFSIEFLNKISQSGDFKKDENLRKNVKNIVGGISVLLTTMETTNGQIAESILKKLKKGSIDISSLASNIRDNNRYSIYEAGKVAYTNKMDSDAQAIRELVESFERKYKKDLSKEKSGAINALKESVDTIVKNDIESDIAAYYKTNKIIKKICESLEDHNIHPNKYKKAMELVAKKKKAVNEAISATKYSIAFYKKYKDEFEKSLEA